MIEFDITMSGVFIKASYNGITTSPAAILNANVNVAAELLFMLATP